MINREIANKLEKNNLVRLFKWNNDNAYNYAKNIELQGIKFSNNSCGSTILFVNYMRKNIDKKCGEVENLPDGSIRIGLMKDFDNGCKFKLVTEEDSQLYKFHITLNEQYSDKIVRETGISLYKLMYVYRKYYNKDVYDFYKYLYGKANYDNFLMLLKMYTIEYPRSTITKALSKGIIKIDITRAI